MQFCESCEDGKKYGCSCPAQFVVFGGLLVAGSVIAALMFGICWLVPMVGAVLR